MSVITFYRCSFCGRPRSEVDHLVVAGDVGICDRCVTECQELIGRERLILIHPKPRPRPPEPEPPDPPTWSELCQREGCTNRRHSTGQGFCIEHHPRRCQGTTKAGRECHATIEAEAWEERGERYCWRHQDQEDPEEAE